MKKMTTTDSRTRWMKFLASFLDACSTAIGGGGKSNLSSAVIMLPTLNSYIIIVASHFFRVSRSACMYSLYLVGSAHVQYTHNLCI